MLPLIVAAALMLSLCFRSVLLPLSMLLSLIVAAAQLLSLRLRYVSLPLSMLPLIVVAAARFQFFSISFMSCCFRSVAPAWSVVWERTHRRAPTGCQLCQLISRVLAAKPGGS